MWHGIYIGVANKKCSRRVMSVAKYIAKSGKILVWAVSPILQPLPQMLQKGLKIQPALGYLPQLSARL